MKKDYYKNRSERPADPLLDRIEGAYHKFFSEFVASNGMQHRPSKGQIRESPVRKFLESLLPSLFSITNGEIIDFNGTTSPECDLIVYRSADGIPVLEEAPTLVQVESVMAVTEVKSQFDKGCCKDFLKKAAKLHELRPFERKLEVAERGRDPSDEDCRIFLSMFAYSSASKCSLEDEYKRLVSAAESVGVDPRLIDRVYILGKGIISPREPMVAKDSDDYKLGLFYFYSNLLQFVSREVKRRKEVPHLQYFGRMSEGWRRI